MDVMQPAEKGRDGKHDRCQNDIVGYFFLKAQKTSGQEYPGEKDDLQRTNRHAREECKADKKKGAIYEGEGHAKPVMMIAVRFSEPGSGETSRLDTCLFFRFSRSAHSRGLFTSTSSQRDDFCQSGI
ncbi:hypothetical protein [Xaviernesmea oryzae]|uniref:hypothetical protein n=1 Tax=Xaviernesmea oryzae TaxID=464029 RepID=UPI0011144281|nr:hypothetical protein [Xaviernesmea oryzae]